MTYRIDVVERPEQQAAVVRGHMGLEEIGGFLGAAFGEVGRALWEQGLTPTGPPFAQYRMTDDGVDVAGGFPVSGPVTPTGRVEAATLPGGDVAEALYVGPYDGVAGAYEAVEAWLSEEGYEPAGPPWESYLDGPEVAEPRTVVSFPCRRP